LRQFGHYPKAVVRIFRITAPYSKSYYTLSVAAKQSRVQHALSQTVLAKRMKSSQSRIAKIEAADPSVSIDLMVRALLASGAGRADVARALR
jgi:Helix-turn-helix